ncbi:hypothetical protein CSQ95_26750 [Janthinobacterium sp. BJB304]|nr:hypothetical protein CSQ95_26750 [Janthinobacterium sp. BJB304]
MQSHRDTVKYSCCLVIMEVIGQQVLHKVKFAWHTQPRHPAPRMERLNAHIVWVNVGKLTPMGEG